MSTKPSKSKSVTTLLLKSGNTGKGIGTKIISFASILILFLVYRNWFLVSEITGGDWWYLSPQMLSNYNIFKPLWSSQESLLGGTNPNYPFLSYSHVVIGVFVNILHIPWNIVSLIFYFLVFIVMSIFSISYLAKTLFPKNSLSYLSLAALLYTTNTYILLVASGGQIGVAISYSLAPLVLATFIKCINGPLFRNTIVAGLVFASQILFDIRITYLTLIAAGIYSLYSLFLKHISIFSLFQRVVIIAMIILGIHAYWIIPYLTFNLFYIPSGVTSTEAFAFFSFATFENAIGFLHPNWPDNIFGKVQFMRPEFIVLSILSFSILLFNYKSENKKRFDISILFLVSIALLGAFFSKGANDPFNNINLWVFDNVPGMNLFRDSTKFYLLIALSYSLLIPQTLSKIAALKLFKIKFSTLQPVQTILPFLFIIFWSILLWPAISGKLGGTLKVRTIPHEYQELADYFSKDPNFYRILGVPTHLRFRYHSELHPIINANTFFNLYDEKKLVASISGKKELLSKLSVKYIVIPYDSEHELFLTDRTYDLSKRISVEQALDEISWLTKVRDDNITIYELDSYNDRFSLSGEGTIDWKLEKPNYYKITINSGESRTVTFSEQYHPGWKVKFGQKEMKVRSTGENLMQFEIPPGTQKVEVFFKPEQYRWYGYVISFIVLVGSLFLITRR